MSYIRKRKGWEIPERSVTSEDIYWNRRRFIKAMGLGSIGALSLATGCEAGETSTKEVMSPTIRNPLDAPARDLYPVKRNLSFTANRSLTPEDIAAGYNNFYEFTTDKEGVWPLAQKLNIKPWEIEITGLVDRPQKCDIDKLIRMMPLEERIYRFRCVEAWAMTVPWTGFPLKALIDKVKPKSSAKYLRFITFMRPTEAPGQYSASWYPWPYFEGLTMAEATNELTLLATGIYGHPLPKQHGAPIRLITPWKYGFKSIKSIVRIEFVEKQPPTFWNKLAPAEYSFTANINPKVPHPRWSQASERIIDTGKRVPTLPYNGYGEYVAQLYKS
ncbi:MAG: protein-methionine-sulfoxide reductase catalytic subunit MsrP [Kiritimatiellae bacterium]|nr:protein-methionine-sulfoxide reductase catalytic subunit MsrP [Kiritimatiellia bacterium]